MKRSIGSKTLAMPTPTWVIGSYDANGKPNIMNAAWGGICNSKPPSIAVSLRPATLSHENITRRKAFTVSITSERQVVETDYVGIVSGRAVDKFAATGWTPVRSDVVDAPYVGEAPLVIECRLVQVSDLGLHTQFVGEIVDVKADEAILDANGLPDITKLRPLLYDTAGRRYFGIGEVMGEAFRIGHRLDADATSSSDGKE
jgi:flavin reductase (DIM6/NTAB) family NADH-FMN oxidoreductase RutF